MLNCGAYRTRTDHLQTASLSLQPDELMPRLVNSCANIRLFLIYALSLYKKFQEKGKKMIVYNTTFHIHKDIVDECLEYLKNSYIPKASESGILYSPYLRRVLDSRNEEGESFSVQFYTRDIDSLNEWVRKEGGALQQDLIGRYKEKIAGFSTLLEDIELPK